MEVRKAVERGKLEASEVSRALNYQRPLPTSYVLRPPGQRFPCVKMN